MFGIDNADMLMTLKVVGIQVAVFCTIIALVWGTQKLYSIIDPVIFPNTAPFNYAPQMPDIDKGAVLIDTITYRIQYELKSTFGWTANDILFSKWLFDNRAYRQYGVYNSTKVLFDFYATNVAKTGNSARENNDLYEARMNYLALSPSRWGILFIPSAESAYKKALRLTEKYKTDLYNRQATYNCRPDSVYNAFQLILSDKLLGYAIGLLQGSQKELFSSLDNKIYEVQGMTLVIRDVFYALYTMYPDIAANGNKENFEEAMGYFNNICTYNPLIITSAFNSGELIISYLLFARNRIEDIKSSIRI